MIMSKDSQQAPDPRKQQYALDQYGFWQRKPPAPARPPAPPATREAIQAAASKLQPQKTQEPSVPMSAAQAAASKLQRQYNDEQRVKPSNSAW
jgi:hypothetical protein